MSTPNTGLILHLNFAEVADGKVADLSDKGNDGTLRGNPQLVPDDNFGSCLSFDGGADYVTLPPGAATDFSQGLTFEAWVFYNALAQWSRIFDFGNGQLSDNILLANAGTTGDLSMHIYRGVTGTELRAAGQLKTGEWMHLAGTVTPAGAGVLYVNGQQVAAGTMPAPANLARQNNYIGKSNWAADALFNGRIAAARVYARALSADEIRQDMADDQTAAASFRASYPLNFRLYDREDNQQVIYITDHPQGREMGFEVSNTSRKAVTLAAPAAPQVSDQNHHFELRLRAGTLSADALGRLALADAGWAMLKPTAAQLAANDGGVSLYFLSAAERTLNPADRITLRLSGVAADPGAGARGTRAELRLRQMNYPSDPTPLRGTRVQHLNVVNQRGQKTIPLHVGFLDSNAVLNDGTSRNQLRLRVTNVSKNALALTPASKPAPSKLIIAFDTRGDTETGKDWALGTASQVNAIQITAPNWTVFKPEAKTPEWVLTTAKTTVAPGEAVELTLAGLVTSLPSGMTNMYLRYENIPGHWDGQFVAVIEKAPIVYRGDKVGVGSAEPQAKLHVLGGAIMPAVGNSEAAGIMFPKDPGGGAGDAAWLRYYVRQGEATTLELGISNDPDDHLALMASGNVGVGMNTPQYKLHVKDNGNTGLRVQTATAGGTVASFGGSGDFNVDAPNITGGRLTVKESGSVGVGVNDPKAKLHVLGGAIMPAVGNSETAGIMFPKDPGGGAGDAAWLRYYVRQGEATTLELGISNDPDDHLILMASGNVGVGTRSPTAKLSVNGTLSLTASDTSPGVTTRVFEGSINNGQTLVFPIYTVRGYRSSLLELRVMMHDTNSNTYRLFQKEEYAIYKEWNNPPKIDLIQQVFRRVNSQDIYRAGPVVSGDIVQLKIAQSGFATNSVYQIVAKYMMVGL